uniref:TIR domain-containing protein n=1 Tax=Heterorhabditis bacteriophora TaxID=37862 RepID=A0A1I7W8H5_HETBA
MAIVLYLNYSDSDWKAETKRALNHLNTYSDEVFGFLANNAYF